MLNKIIEALNGRSDLAGWTVRHLLTSGAQVYAVPEGIESQRLAEVEQYKIDVLRQTTRPDGAPGVGSGNSTVLPGGDIQAAIEQAVLVAGLVANPVHTLPAPSELPNVPLIDAELQKDAVNTTRSVMERIRAAASGNPDVYLTAAECFGEIHQTHLVNSRGIDAQQEATKFSMEFVLHSRRADNDVEYFSELSRRRVADINIEEQIEEKRRYTMDLFDAGSPPTWQGPVVLRGEVLAGFMSGDELVGAVIQSLGSADSKYAKLSPWEVGQSVFKGEVKGDPLTIWANRCIPYGTESNRFDGEGLPAQRVALIQNNELVTFSASQRYADYLNIPATGAFGAVEVAPGTMDAASLLAEPYVEIIQFSWFNPDSITGDFTTEIRLGYLVENGVRKPFKGGQLIGNYMEALADAHWSTETGFFGNYLGPHTVRFNDLKIAGESG